MVDVPTQSTEQTDDPAPAKRFFQPTIGTGAHTGPFEASVGGIWRFFSSVRAAIWEIAFLAVLTLIGTLRGSNVPEGIANRIPPLSGLVDAWYDWEVFGSWLYTATLAVIAIAIIIGGMLNRISGMYRTIVQPTVTTSRSFLRGTAPHATIELGTNPEGMVDELRGALTRRRYRVLTAQVGPEIHLYADRNRWGKLGTFPFHIALVMVVVGGIIVTQFGFRDVDFVVPEGSTIPIGRGTDLSVRLNKFNEDYYQDGTASQFQSDISLFRDGEEVRSGMVEPNRPVSEGGVSVYQSGFGYNVSLRVTDLAGNTLFDGPVTLGQFESSNNPDAPAGVLRVPGTNVTLNLIASDRDIANRPDLDLLNLSAQQLYVQARNDDLVPGSAPPTAIIDPLNPGQLGNLNVQFERYGVYSVLQIAYYPGLWIFGVAAVIGIAGLIAIFYFPVRRVRAIISQGTDGRSVGILAPLARRDWSGKRGFVDLVEDLQRRHQGTVRLSDAPDRPGPQSAS